MSRLLLPLAGIVTFFLLSLVTVRTLKPRQPRLFFLGYAAMLLVVTAYAYVRLWPLRSLDDGAGLLVCLLLQTLMCLTMWNSFYSLLWGFSGGLMHDLYNEEDLRHVDRLVGSYERGPQRGAPNAAAALGTPQRGSRAGDPVRERGLDRILSRRLPNLDTGGYIKVHDEMLRLRWKGRIVALGTLATFKIFSLGMGGGVNRVRDASVSQK
jgi:hypothetical protein